MKTQSPGDLLFDQLQDLYSAATQELSCLPGLVERVGDPTLNSHLSRRVPQMRTCRETIGAILRSNGFEPGTDPCKAMQGLIEGGEAHLDAVDAPAARDLMMIAHCLRIEGYGIAACSITLSLASRLGFNSEAAALTRILREREEATAALRGMEDGIFAAALRTP